MSERSREIMDFLSAKRRAFEANTPGLGCIKIFLEQLNERVRIGMPAAYERVRATSKRWESAGDAARDLNAGAEINWSSPIILEALFKDIEMAL